MQGKTHKQGGMLISILGFAYLRKHGLLIPDVNEVLQWLILYPFCMWGSTASDLDHRWESCPSRDYPSKLINTALHITEPLQKACDNAPKKKNKKKEDSVLYGFASLFNAKHRSWQTHSDLTLYLLFFIINLVVFTNIFALNLVELSILRLVLTGVTLGVTAHFILDMLTPEGIWIIGFVILNEFLKLINPKIKIPRKLHLVPHSKFFATGEKWEQFINKLLKFSTWVALIWCFYTLAEPYIPYELNLTNLTYK